MDDPSRSIVDVDQPASWPRELAELVQEMASEARSTIGDGAETACSELALGAYEDDVRRLLDGHLLRAYHATRLLPHEVEAITNGGLQVLTDDLVLQRLDAAHAAGYLTDAERRRLAEHRTVDKARRSKVCFFLSKKPLTDRPHGFHLLLSTWGGEGIYWGHADNDDALRAKLRSLGTPTIVVASLDFTIATNNLRTFAALANVFTGSMLGLRDVGADISYFAPVPATNIERMLQPGQSGYPQHQDIPQC